MQGMPLSVLLVHIRFKLKVMLAGGRSLLDLLAFLLDPEPGGLVVRVD